MEEKENIPSPENERQAEFADISPRCCEKLQGFERELNKQGFYNIALVAYQMKD